jgi:hypothetical protein
VLSGKRRLEICAKGVRLGENSAERKARLFSAYVAAETATHKALHCSAGSKKKNRSLAVLGMTGLERSGQSGKVMADEMRQTMLRGQENRRIVTVKDCERQRCLEMAAGVRMLARCNFGLHMKAR